MEERKRMQSTVIRMEGTSLRMNSFLIQEHKYSPCLTVFFYFCVFSPSFTFRSLVPYRRMVAIIYDYYKYAWYFVCYSIPPMLLLSHSCSVSRLRSLAFSFSPGRTHTHSQKNNRNEVLPHTGVQSCCCGAIFFYIRTIFSRCEVKLDTWKSMHITNDRKHRPKTSHGIRVEFTYTKKTLPHNASKREELNISKWTSKPIVMKNGCVFFFLRCCWRNAKKNNIAMQTIIKKRWEKNDENIRLQSWNELWKLWTHVERQ